MAEIRPKQDVEMKGWLMKWTNYIKGYQRRWFVLSNGLLSYYRNQAEMAHTCRGTISLHGALIHTVDSCTFVISNGGTQTFHIRAANEVERQRWVTALELAKAKAIRAMESEDEEDVEFDHAHKREMESAIKCLNSRLEDLQTCNELINRHGGTLQRSLSELECLDNAQDITTKMKAINERATLFRISSNAMINACAEFLDLAQSQGQKWQKMLQHEQDQRQRLEEIIEQLARQQNILEQAAKTHQMQASLSASSDEEDEDGAQFFDAESDQKQNSHLSLVPPMEKPTKPLPQLLDTQGDEASGSSSDVDEQNEQKTNPEASTQGKKKHLISNLRKTKEKKPSKVKQTVPSQPIKPAKETSSLQLATYSSPLQESEVLTETQALCRSIARPGHRRTRVPDRPNSSLNLWSIMKNCIGKELSKIPMPVNFSEPLSMLQRLTEDYEYADVLDRAAECSDSTEQMAYVAAFTVSSYSSTAYRTGKPFNPLLGETYECDRRDDLGWRAISEQVSHHPPMVAQHCEGKKWVCWQEFTMTSKFRGKYLQVVPMGIAHCYFPESGNHYTWRKVTTTVHNIIVGKLWLDQHGDMEIFNHKDGTRCKLSYIPYSYFTRDVQRRVTGSVRNKHEKSKWLIKGTWDGQIDIAPVTSEDLNATPPYTAGPYVTAWKRNDPPVDHEKFYNFTLLACQLNEMEEGIAPTDSRLRPDQRLMEEGRWQEANLIKHELEEKQRMVRRQRENNAEQAASDGSPYSPYEPLWFKKEMEPATGNLAHIYKGGYWEAKEKQDWSMCPDIF
ncbi:oxysterol-binding protein 1-like [Macrosteles quadrilineatus]|uniref:oxysterol-binding protein 1-like n=1 Tax=Macrosteles quadrilineatus TaxID=74068 RepID=UPI0023E1C35C|nr:oxysterol-binding protein 1-like [Macrosteles quadrilineatus]XP_054280481.1 oxysterol-binding protein 1-like [Macrosteles quadrilineatus]